MTTANIAYTTPTDAGRWKRWLLFSPTARIVLFFVGMAVISGILSAIVIMATGTMPGSNIIHRPLAYYGGQVLPAIIAY
ncbi:MAG TPA: CPBP family intramembrane glutamate endopeptidase, partial [Oleiagrimonas sp.]|nr:CPBP family intramembrane glutamate endopeptidase [Oleiagrimonas sp.]